MRENIVGFWETGEWLKQERHTIFDDVADRVGTALARSCSVSIV